MKKKNVSISIVLTIISIIYTFLVKTVDVGQIGPYASSVGFSKINKLFINFIGSNMTIYKLTEILGLMTFIIVGIYGIIGLIELVKRKSLFKVDKEIISLGVLYVLMLMVYVFFEKFIINYRPILLDGELEASFPSSHTILSICICVSSLIVSKKYVPKKYINITTFVTVLLLTMVLLGRTISGVHWISDIVGGIIISITLLSYFITVLNWKKEK